MTINNNSAYPYVKAIFAVALESNSLPAWEKLLQSWATAVQLFPQLFSTCRVVDKSKQLELLLETCQAASIGPSQAARNLLQLLITKKQLLLLPKIIELYQNLYSKHRQIPILKVVCAMELNEEQKQRLENALKIRQKSDVQLNYTIDANLIGGIKIYLNDQVMDLSISGQLQRMKTIINARLLRDTNPINN